MNGQNPPLATQEGGPEPSLGPPPLPDHATWNRLTNDGLLTRGPCLLYAIEVENSLAAAAVFNIYVGTGTNGRLFWGSAGSLNLPSSLRLTKPVLIDGPLYAELGPSCLSILAIFQLLPQP